MHHWTEFHVVAAFMHGPNVSDNGLNFSDLLISTRQYSIIIDYSSSWVCTDVVIDLVCVFCWMSFQLLVLIVRVACSINSWCLINIATQLLLCIFDFSNEISPYIYIYIYIYTYTHTYVYKKHKLKQSVQSL